MAKASKRARLAYVTVAALSSTFMSSAAFADCVAGSGQFANLVTCDSPGGLGTIGYNGAATNGLTIQVNGGALVQTAPNPANSDGSLLSGGTGTTVNNFGGNFAGGVGSAYGIQAASASTPAVTIGGGSTFTNTSNADMKGTITFGSPTGAAVNTLNNNYSITSSVDSIGNIDGNIISSGNTTINNGGFLGFNSGGNITQTGTGTVVINNGVAAGFISPYTIAATQVQNSAIVGSISTVGDTTLNNNAGTGGHNAYIFGGVTLGSGGVGTMVVNNSGVIVGNVTMNGATNTYNAGTVGSSSVFTTTLPGNGTGTLSGFLGSNNTLNLYGTSASNQFNATVNNFQTVNKNDTGTWTLTKTLDGNPGKLTKVNVKGGTLSTNDASFLGGGSSVVSLFDGTTLNFNGTAAGTFSGNIVDGLNQTTGGVTVTGPSTTTLSGTNTYHGTTIINGGTLSTGSNGALSANSDLTVRDGGTLIVNNQNTVKSIVDFHFASTAPVINLANANASLTFGSGFWGDGDGKVIGTGTLIKNTTGVFVIDGGPGAIDLSAGGVFRIDDGTVNMNFAGGIGTTTAVQVNSNSASNPTTTGILNINQNDTIGSLNGTGANAQVNIASGKVLTTGGLATTDSFAGKIAGLGGLTKTGAGTMTLLGFNTYGGGTTISGGTLIGYAGTTGTNSSLQGNFSIGSGATLTFNQALNPGGNSGTYGGGISSAAPGNGTVNFNGTNGTTLLTLTGDNHNFTGLMNFNSGTVAISVANNLGTGPLGFAGGTLENTANVTLANTPVTLNVGGGTFLTDASTTLTLNGQVTGAGGLTKTGAGTLILGNVSGGTPNNYTGGTTVSAGTLQGQAATGIQGNITDNVGGLVKFTGTGTYAGNISGGGAVEIAPTATTFSGTNTYAGKTTVDTGATLIAGTNNLSVNSIHFVNGTGILSLTGNNSGAGHGINGLTSTSGGTVNMNGFNLDVGDSGDNTFGGTINGGGGTSTLTVKHTNGDFWDFTGTASGLATFNNSAFLYLDGSVTAATGSNSGTLEGNGTFTGAFTNNGTINPGHSPGILNFVGSYAQSSSGTYVVDLVGNNNHNNGTAPVAGSDYDQIKVTGTPGTATLAGNLTINQNGGEFVNGTVYHIITTTSPTLTGTNGTVINDFNSFTGLTISSFIHFTHAVNNTVNHTGAYDLTVVRTNYNTVANNPNQAAVAGLTGNSGLQGLVGVNNATGIVSAVDNMSDGDARSFFDQISPEAYGAYVVALQDQGNLFSRQVAHRMTSAKSGGDAKMAIWGNLYGQWGNGKHQSFRHGSDQDIKGGALGVDGNVGTDFTLGAAVGYSEDDVKYRLGNVKGKSKSWQVGGYASYHPGKLAADLQVDYIHGKMNAVQRVAVGSGFSALSAVAHGNTSGNLLKVVGTVGYSLGSETLAFTPFVGVDFTTGHLGGFNLNETGGGPLLETVLRQKANRTDLLAGFKFAPNMGKLTPYADATIRYGMSRNHGFVSAYFDGLPSDLFTVSAERPNKMQGELDAGLSYAIGKSGAIFFGYQGTIRSDLTEHGVNGGVKFAF